MEDEPTTGILKANNWTLDQALDRFADRTHAALRAARKTPTVWQEMVRRSLYVLGEQNF